MTTDPHDTCGCCAPIASPAVSNPPGAPSLRYRIDSHAGFYQRMLADLPGRPPLDRLTTRALDDASIAVLDGWAVLADILTFYQERIANEGFLGTSTERRSLQELAAMIGYQLKPGVAAGTHLAFTVEAPAATPSITPGATAPMAMSSPTVVPVPSGTRVQSVPGPGELPQTFETTAAITARLAWNAIRGRQRQRQQLGVSASGQVTWRRVDGSAPAASSLWLATAAANLIAGDVLVVQVTSAHRVVGDPVSQACTTGVAWVQVAVAEVDNAAGVTRVGLQQAGAVGPPAFELPALPAGTISTAPAAMTAAVVGPQIVARTWTEPALAAQLAARRWDGDRLLAQVAALQAAAPAPASVWALRQVAAGFGAAAPPHVTLPAATLAIYGRSWDATATAATVWQRSDATLYSTEGVDLFLDRVVDGLAPGGWVLLARPGVRELFKITAVTERALADYAISGKATGLTLARPDGSTLTDSWKTGAGAAWTLRSTTVRLAAAPLPLASAPITDPIGPTTARIITDAMVLGLAAGQTIAVSGEALDEVGAALGPRTELAALDRVEHVGGLSVLYLEAPLTMTYGRASFAVCANLAPATHGETVTEEPLGSGDGRGHQQRTLKRPPLTLVSAPTASGTASTLTVRVGGVGWREVPSLYQAAPTDRVFQTRTGDDGRTTITFGDGVRGVRPPTGRDNLTASYRTGMGLAGNVGAGTLTLLASRPLGVRAVVNPLAATGAEAPEAIEQARGNAPLTVRTLDRIVSLTDYQDFARGFAGIAKARAVEVWDGHGRLVHVTIAGFDGAAIASTSMLYQNLVAAIGRLGDGIDRFAVAGHVPRNVALEATITVDPDRIVADVQAAAIAAIETAYAFAARELAAPVTEADVVTRLMAIAGVIAVRVTRLHRVDRAPAAEAVIAASDARWDPATRQVTPAELLTLLPANLRLTAVTP